MSGGYTLPPPLARIQKLGFKVFEDGAYNLNLFGIRSPSKQAGTFNDLLGCAYKTAVNSEWRVAYWPATTDPGVYYLESPMNVAGCAALVADKQYRGAYQIGLHRGKYRALVQRGPVSVYRDDNRDKVLDYDPSTIIEGLFGINIHKAGAASTVVGRWSAGCQVHATTSGHEDMMSLVDKQLSAHPTWTKMTYTLLSQWW